MRREIDLDTTSGMQVGSFARSEPSVSPVSQLSTGDIPKVKILQ